MRCNISCLDWESYQFQRWHCLRSKYLWKIRFIRNRITDCHSSWMPQMNKVSLQYVQMELSIRPAFHYHSNKTPVTPLNSHTCTIQILLTSKSLKLLNFRANTLSCRQISTIIIKSLQECLTCYLTKTTTKTTSNKRSQISISSSFNKPTTKLNLKISLTNTPRSTKQKTIEQFK